MPDMNELLRSGVTPPPQDKRPRTTIETYRALSALAREHEWANLTKADRAIALREGIQPAGVESIGGKADAGVRSDRDAGEATDMNERLREAWRATYIE